jgi:hypothetical protein
MTAPDGITPGERRELRSVVRGQFKVLRAEVKRREEELQGEVEAELLRQYRAQDDAIAQAKTEWSRAYSDYLLAVRKIGDDLKERRPELIVDVQDCRGSVAFVASDPNRAQAHRAAVAAIPRQIADASLSLDRSENDILRELSAGAVTSDEARAFLGRIPSVGELVPRARLAEIELSLAESS